MSENWKFQNSISLAMQFWHKNSISMFKDSIAYCMQTTESSDKYNKLLNWIAEYKIEEFSKMIHSSIAVLKRQQFNSKLCIQNKYIVHGGMHECVCDKRAKSSALWILINRKWFIFRKSYKRMEIEIVITVTLGKVINKIVSHVSCGVCV